MAAHIHLFQKYRLFKLENAVLRAIANNILFNDFTDTMTVGTYQDQIERTLQVKDENLVYYGIVMFGDWDKVTELTRKFSLWR